MTALAFGAAVGATFVLLLPPLAHVLLDAWAEPRENMGIYGAGVPLAACLWITFAAVRSGAAQPTWSAGHVLLFACGGIGGLALCIGAVIAAQTLLRVDSPAERRKHAVRDTTDSLTALAGAPATRVQSVDALLHVRSTP